jgi:hypothetical protein
MDPRDEAQAQHLGYPPYMNHETSAPGSFEQGHYHAQEIYLVSPHFRHVQSVLPPV